MSPNELLQTEPRPESYLDDRTTRAPGFRPSLFRSFFLGGFECSSHRRGDRSRIDMMEATRHDVLAENDYRQLAGYGIRSVRDGLRWHRIETSPGRYDWSEVLPMLRSAERLGTEVSWDLLHYGWPDDLDAWSGEFVDRFARYAAAFARLHGEETGRAPTVCPVNEISFMAFAAGDRGWMNPWGIGRGGEFKRQMVRTALAGARAVREAAPGARILAIDPIINIAPRDGDDPEPVERYNGGQYEAWDMLFGHIAPELGGGPDAADVIGFNFYWNNQWIDNSHPLSPFDKRYIPPRELFRRTWERYGLPIFMAETSIEGDRRPGWLRFMGEEVRAAIRDGVPIEGMCLYPVLSHPGWDDGRYCPNGLLEMATEGDGRVVDAPLLAELREQQRLFAAMFGD
ncbi:glycoside hydrolase family 1 protein [Roseomonas elaeocarpi]|uniref:Beta-glucosidase n=1 Tax=Roseomonas elaeocarpi TaxID=907779 RepID=A0ABV6JNX0_9PROT